MASFRDACKRLEIIYQECCPEAIEQRNIDKSLDEFSRLKKKAHQEAKSCRALLKDREVILQKSGTSTESAEISYRIRVEIRTLREDAERMNAILDKEIRKSRNKDPKRIEERKEILDLVRKHITELEMLEKRKAMDLQDAERSALGVSRTAALNGGPVRGGPYGGGTYGEDAPDALPDIDVEEDFKRLNEGNKQIDATLDQIGNGVAQLKAVANAMTLEVDRQNEQIDEIEKGVNKALDHVDNVNIKMKKTLDGVMKGDRFIVNCVMLCILLAFIGYISSQFV
ncbi:hypothetical protein CXG81DRAFT_14834 [Caulochytrium protostelioides]|uniref:t-SNARE coiled-coil homology domain-containing protein n=1 Tax=Caulochytrium protostelioides TaxID=1555241 RepID=A0A4P9X017_9FUNG|nr:hypothetical protein CXG81DRAFT_14834 [Caulochytrium protostelioides]|eukprot:RKO99199.1 hypothetical protein CXG81DRAFT_14834 [Caulochytrium protostelioides]